MNNTAIVVSTRPNFSGYYSDWKKILTFDQDNYILCDVTSGDIMQSEIILNASQDNIINYSINNIRETFNFHIEPSHKHWWNNGGGRNIIWFYPHLRMLYFYLNNPNYEYYWFFDDDVTFPQGNFNEFIDTYKDKDYDCMITYIFSNLNNKNLSNVLTMDKNMGSYHNHDFHWLTHYPGNGDNHSPNIKEIYGSYFPLVRLSNKSMKILLDDHKNGYYGYSEGYVPTTLNHYNLKLYSIFNKESKVDANKNITIYHRRYLDLVWKNI